MNPFLPIDEYIPDGEPHVFGDRIYLFGSHDKEGGDTFCMLDYAGYSAPVHNLTEWKYEGIIYRAAQDPMYSEKYCHLYAPDVVQGKDGRYYLYYALAGPETFTGPIHVAVCDEPVGQYEYYGSVSNPDGTPYTRYITFDPAVLNDDGTIRLYYGWALATDKKEAVMALHSQDKETAAMMREKLIQIEMKMFDKSRDEIESETEGIMGANVVELEDDMLTVRSQPKRIVPGQFDAAGSSFEGHAFFEGSSIRKVGEIYYFIYSSELSHELCYARSRYPDRDFVYGGTIISNGDVGYQGRKAQDRLNMTGNNHGSIEKAGEDWYVFYHRHTHNSSYSRQACAEPIILKDDGTILQVEMTSLGFERGKERLENRAFPASGTYPAAAACNLTNGHMPHLNGKGEKPIPHITHRGEERFITGIENGTQIGYKYFQFHGSVEIRLRVRGTGAGTFQISLGDAVQTGVKYDGCCAKSEEERWEEICGTLCYEGKTTLLLSYQGEGTVELSEITFSEKV